jgi:hypothetical protein
LMLISISTYTEFPKQTRSRRAPPRKSR